MPGDLDQISAAIGELRADAKNQRAANDRVFDKLEEISTQLSSVSSVKDTVDRIEPLVDKHERAHTTGRGIIIGLSLVSGTAGGFLSTLAKKLGISQ